MSNLMSISEVATQYGKNAKDTGNTKVQIALLTQRVNHLSTHLQANKKDHANKVSLLKMVGQRRKLLRYLQRNSLEDYRSLIKDLGLRH